MEFRLHADESTRERLARAGRERFVRSYSEAVLAQSIDNIVQSAIRGAGGGTGLSTAVL